MRILKSLLKVLGLLVVVLALAVGVFAWRGNAILTKRWDVQPVAATDPSATVDLASGEHQARIRGCLECHGADLGGQVLALTPVGPMVPPNLTRGQGGVTAKYTDADWQRAIRHGVGPGGRPLILMPSDDNTSMSETDFAALVAYVQSMPPVDRVNEPTSLNLLGKILLGAGQLPMLTVERIDHTQKPKAVAVAATAEYGAYLAGICSGCHGANFAGGPAPGLPPDAPQAANLTPAGRAAAWSTAEFATTLRTGKRPDGTQMQPQFMPWPAFSHMTDVEIEALQRYFQSLPPADKRT